MLPWERVLFLLSVGTIGCLGAFVLVRGRRGVIRVTFSIFLFLVALLDVNIFAIRIAAGRELVKVLDILGRSSFAVGGLGCGALWAFTEVFPRARKGSLITIRLARRYAVGILAGVTALTPWFWKGVEISEGEFKPVLGWGAVPWAAMLLFGIGAAVANLIRNYQVLPRGHLRNQVRYTFLGFSVLALPAALFNVLLPSLGNVSYTSVVPFFGSITAMIITYAVVRHRLMDLGIVFRTAIISVTVVALVVVALLGLQSFLSNLLKFPLLASTIIAAVIVAAGFQPLKEQVTSLLDKYVYRGRYDYRKVVVEFGEKISRILDLKALEKCVVESTMETLLAENGLILEADGNLEHYRTEYAVFPESQVIMDRILSPGNKLLEELKNSKRVIVEQEVRRTQPERLAAPILEEMTQLRSAIVIPLVSKDELLGILSLGEKLSGDIYSTEDVSLLMILANQVASSLENARLFNEILVVKNHQDKILQRLRSGVITVDQDNRIKSVNRSAAEILRRPIKRLVMRDASELGPKLSGLVTSQMQEGSGHFQGEVPVEVKTRGTVPLGVVATTITGERENRWVLLVFDDLSEVKRLQERIRRADRLAVVGTFAAGMAHEIKNPLVPIKTFSQLLPEMFDDHEFRNRFSVLVLKEVERINQIVEKLLNFARPSKPVPAPCDLHGLIDEVLLLLEEEVKQKKIELRRGYTNKEAVLKVDKEQMKQVLLNLMLNAVQAVGREGRIEVFTSYVWEPGGNGDGRRSARGRRSEEVSGSAGNKVQRFQIKIKDTGCGISDENLKHLFDPFFTTKPEGTGLGLAISHVIVQEHNGVLDAESNPGHGAIFTVKLPVNNEL